MEKEEDKFVPLDPEAMIDLGMRRKAARRKRLFYDLGPYAGGLTAKRDVQIRYEIEYSS